MPWHSYHCVTLCWLGQLACRWVDNPIVPGDEKGHREIHEHNHRLATVKPGDNLFDRALFDPAGAMEQLARRQAGEIGPTAFMRLPVMP